jgi:arginyl-tRNA synthetase
MLDVVSLIQNKVSICVEELFSLKIPKDAIDVEVPANEKFGDYSSNIAMILAKELKQPPLEIAKNIRDKLEEQAASFIIAGSAEPVFASFEHVAPGFINFKYSSAWLNTLLSLITKQNASYGAGHLSAVAKIALEHSNVNPNKAPHIGHLRNAAIGRFIEKSYEFIGNNVDVQYYSNDVGVQVATSFLGTKTIKNITPHDYSRFDYYAWDIYAEISQKLENDDALRNDLTEILKTIEDPQHPLSTEVAAFADKILKDQLQTFNELDIVYDVIIHERDIVYSKMWDKCFEILKTNPNFYLATKGKSKGCWLLKNNDETNTDEGTDFEKDKIIVRSNGIPTYTGKDIAYHMWKFGLLGKDFGYTRSSLAAQDKILYETTPNSSDQGDVTYSNADLVIDVIDQKQTYAINVVKESLKTLGYENEAKNMHHINYGFVYLSNETARQLGVELLEDVTKYEMSGRKGIGVKILEFINLIDARLNKEYGEFSAKKDVRNGAILFEMLKYNTFNDVVFDLDTALNVKGFSGPYIQYTHARICSVLKKANVNDIASLNLQNDFLDESAISLVTLLSRFDTFVMRSAIEFAPNLMCEYLFKVAKLFNAYYNDYSILNAETPSHRDFRLVAAFCTKIVLHNGLLVLGINAPEKI